MIRYVLDTSAILAHYFDEPGADEVDAIWSDGHGLPAISAPTVTELRSRLGEEVADVHEASLDADLYINELTRFLPVDRAIAEAAYQLRVATLGRLPLVDALIAATARSVGAVLVHRDPHFDDIPKELLEQMRLPER